MGWCYRVLLLWPLLTHTFFRSDDPVFFFLAVLHDIIHAYIRILLYIPASTFYVSCKSILLFSTVTTD